MKPARSKAQQRDETRRLLIDTGRRLFAEQGYHAVGLAEIAAAADLTKGALYHHFGSKAGLFHAVVESVQQEVAIEVAAAADAAPTPWEQFVAGCRAFLTASAAAHRQRIMLVDGPSVLGWHRWRELDEQASAAHLTEALRTLMSDRVIADQPVEPLTRLLSGAMNEAALWLAGSTDQARDLAAVIAALDRLLGSLRNAD
ncbi:TetR/AcrR family transcriptional regulator [Actinoalloteichus hymeniacidonis]|uniref:Transcriptional regulator, TetR family n=1 Tax=Actinoalloteichus hymeniacidonis TaxID=340345 RepID=A0AAC9HVU8_9PSEU|nr:TetR/AcrR family transcriptional regulator [Actinoalloteichus hymeniacidonis]AOS66101.1 transcriptional regulator, TetR family [Actinoalloteichus hymeniacidonis]MBB5905795.1 AcrR family transcriptional regulator [Actinoalloteichus hymeniacidonis]